MPTMRARRLEFSQAVETYSGKESLCIRPKKTLGEALAPDAALGMEEEMIDPEELQETEAREIPGQKIVYQPTRQEVDDHNRTHFPFRKWCPFCVRGKCRTGERKRQIKSEEELERERPH